MSLFRRLCSFVLVAVVLISACVCGVSAKEADEYAVLFTHDLHSHFLPILDEDGKSAGGYARIKTVFDKERKQKPQAITVDGGDFSMGSLFQTGFKDLALELRIMGKMGYDVTTFGNHEFDYLPEGLASMLTAAKESGEYVPEIVEANYKAPADTKDGKLMQEAFDLYGVKDYTIIEREGLYYVVFGIFGEGSHAYAPNSGMIWNDPVKYAQSTVDKAVKECKDKYGKDPLVVCLSHSGTEGKEGEDVSLAESVEGIDLIVSGHSHSIMQEPLKVEDTYIVSSGEYGKDIGVINLTPAGDTFVVSDYRLVSIDSSITEDKEIAQYVEDCKESINKTYLAPFGLTFDEVLLNNPYKFDTVNEVYETQHDSTLGSLFADSYKWIVEKETGLVVDMALTASGVIRETVPKGNVTVSNIFDAASLGVGTEGELVMVYLTGKDLKSALEVDASIQPIMNSAQLFPSGVKYSFNQFRMIFNRVDRAKLLRNDGTLESIDNDKLYRVVTGMYMGQMLGTVESKSFGLVKVTPRDEKGNPIASDDLVNYVVMDKEGKPIKEWYAICAYMQEMGGTMDEKYSAPDGRKTVYKSLWPWDMLRNPNIFTFAAIGVILLFVGIIVLVVVLIVKKCRKKKARVSQMENEKTSENEEKTLKEDIENKDSNKE